MRSIPKPKLRRPIFPSRLLHRNPNPHFKIQIALLISRSVPFQNPNYNPFQRSIYHSSMEAEGYQKLEKERECSGDAVVETKLFDSKDQFITLRRRLGFRCSY